MTAKEMFLKLEFILIEESKQRLVYRNVLYKKVVIFNKFSKCYSTFIDHFNNLDSDGAEYCSVDNNLYKAIIQQAKELGWIK